MVPASKDGLQDPRPRGRFRIPVSVLCILLYVADIGFLVAGGFSFKVGLGLSVYVLVALGLFFSVGTAQILRRRIVRQGLGGQERTEPRLVVTDGQHELEAVSVVPVEV